MNATIRLYQEGGVSGPHGTIDTTHETVMDDAVAWADGQTGHPWDGMLVSCEDGEAYEFRCTDGGWEAV